MSPGKGDDALLLLLRDHEVEDAAPWLQRGGVTSRKHLLDVTEEDVQAAGLPTFVARRFAKMLEVLRVVQVLEESTDVPEIVAAMRGHAGRAGVQAAGCRRIRLLMPTPEGCEYSRNTNGEALSSCQSAYAKLADDGVDDVLLAAMQMHTSSGEVQRLACRVLSFLLRVDTISVDIAAKGGIEVVLKAVEAHGSSSGAQEWGCIALGNLATREDNSLAIAKKGGIQAVLQAMKAHGSSAGVQRSGCFALGNLCAWDVWSNADNQAIGGIEAVLKAMRDVSSAGVQESGCLSLGKLASNNADQRETIAANGGIEAVVKAMVVHGSNAGVLASGCVALLSVSCEESMWGTFSFSGPGAQAAIRAKILEVGAAELVRRALAAFPRHEVLQSNGKKLLGTLGQFR